MILFAIVWLALTGYNPDGVIVPVPERMGRLPTANIDGNDTHYCPKFRLGSGHKCWHNSAP